VGVIAKFRVKLTMPNKISTNFLTRLLYKHLSKIDNLRSDYGRINVVREKNEVRIVYKESNKRTNYRIHCLVSARVIENKSSKRSNTKDFIVDVASFEIYTKSMLKKDILENTGLFFLGVVLWKLKVIATANLGSFRISKL